MTNMQRTEWGPSGKLVYERTYSRDKEDGTKENWFGTVHRVVDGNTSLVDSKHLEYGEKFALTKFIGTFGLLPAGRHLWASGVSDRQFLFNCWHSGWSSVLPSDHFAFTFMRLMEGGGVGANYSTKKVSQYGPPCRNVDLRVITSQSHRDYKALRDAGLIDEWVNEEDVTSPAAFISVEDSREGWAEALTWVLDEAWARSWSFQVSEYASTIYVDVSDVRPEGAPLSGFGGTASGPVPLVQMLRAVVDVTNRLYTAQMPMNPLDAMEIDHAIAQCVVAGGVRRSARMAIVPWDDPNIFEFINCKSDFSSHWTTNISVAVDSDFYVLFREGDPHAVAVMKAISSGMLANGEPGIWNWEYSQEGEAGVVDSTNPCGEIPLEEWEACNLGHINLEYFAPHAPGERFDLAQAEYAARLMTRFLIRATYGDITDYKSRRIMDRNRRIGVGLTGVQSALAKMGIRYSESWDSDEFRKILQTLRDAVDDEAREYAHKLRIPAPVKTTTIAPTGTISKLPGVTEGIHPVYARFFIRRIRFSNIRPEEVAMVEQYRADGYHVEPDIYSENTTVVSIPTMEKLVEEVRDLGYPEEIVESADEVSLEDLMSVQSTVQSIWANNAVSFTANIDASGYTPERLASVLDDYGMLTKGTTIMPRNDSRPQSPYQAITREEYEAATAKQVADSVDESCATGACPIK